MGDDADLAAVMYQIVGYLADEADLFEADQVVRVMDNLSAISRGEKLPHDWDSLFPFAPAVCNGRLNEPRRGLPTNQT